MRRRIQLSISSLLVNALLGETALACTVCFGNKEASLTQGIGWGIFVLLGILVGIFVLFGIFLYTVNKRSRMAAS